MIYSPWIFLVTANSRSPFLKASYIFFCTCQIETVFVLMGVLINQYVFPHLLCEWLSVECRLCAHPL